MVRDKFAKFSPKYAWIRRGAQARLKVRIKGIPAGTICSVRGGPDSELVVPVRFDKPYGHRSVQATQIEQA